MIIMTLLNILFTYHIIEYKIMKFTQQRHSVRTRPLVEPPVGNTVMFESLCTDVADIQLRLLQVEDTINSLTECD